MKIILTTGLVVLGLAAVSASHAQQTMTVNDHLQEFRAGTSAVYGRSHATDIGNSVPRTASMSGNAEQPGNCADMPCCKKQIMTMEECPRLMKKR